MRVLRYPFRKLGELWCFAWYVGHEYRIGWYSRGPVLGYGAAGAKLTMCKRCARVKYEKR